MYLPHSYTTTPHHKVNSEDEEVFEAPGLEHRPGHRCRSCWCKARKQDESVRTASNLIKLHPIRLRLHHTLHNLFERPCTLSTLLAFLPTALLLRLVPTFHLPYDPGTVCFHSKHNRRISAPQ
ncbi:hypothetical protein E2C01_013024 [Portunus trituberculatus]|uniref:Uncharacterized protein n=1 Tax=Portunus trituberculatus TaxID=210409 RepID=A0A5B7DFU6_PORTR|nr:hypothetical protein [Portunus trituberculatus]